MSRTLAEVADLLTTLAAEDEAQATTLAADYPRAACRVRARSQLLAALAVDVQHGAASKPAVRTVRKARDALAFWAAHRQAQDAIVAVWGLGWAYRAPIDHTVLVTVPAALRSCRTERGTLLKWRADHRMPAGAYWPGGRLPIGLTVTPEGPRESADWQVADAAD